jgi:broad specificity phosphatase PhoE
MATPLPVIPAPPAALCIRHGLTVWNAVFRWQGRADIELTDEGRAQAKRAAASLAAMPIRFDVLICSPLSRARETANLIGESLSLEVSYVDERLVERDIGEWSGLQTEEIEQRWPGMLERWRRDGIERTPGGELESDMTARVKAALESVLGNLQAGQRALVVAHGGVIHTLDHAYGVKPRPYDNLEGRWFGWEANAVRPGQSVTLDPQAVRRKGTVL